MKSNITFTSHCSKTHVTFLDTKVKFKDGKLITELYTKPSAGADLEIKRGGFHLPETQSQLGVWGCCKPPVGPGQGLGGGPGGEASGSSPDFEFFLP